jgi:hypothetical protein
MEHKLCWWCCHSWSGEFLHMPFKIDPKTKKHVTMGDFCSWECMAAFNMDKNGLQCGSKINSLIASAYKQATGHLRHPKPAPSRYVLKSFGGKLSIDEYRELGPNNHPIISMPGQLHKVHIVDPAPRSLFTKPTPIDPTHEKNEDTHEPLKLKRTKPLKRDQNNLENMMGLKREKKK